MIESFSAQTVERPLCVAIVPTFPGVIFPPRPSHSIGRMIEFLIRGLQELGHKVMLFAAADSQVNCEVVPVCQTPVFLEEDPGFNRTRQIQELTLRKLEAYAHRLNVIHAHSLDIPNFFYSTHLLEIVTLPNVTTLHSCIEVSNYSYFAARKNWIVSISLNQQQACQGLKFLTNVYHGLDPSPFVFVAKPDDYLCFLGRIDQVKQPHLAMHLAIQRGMKLKVAGPINPRDPTDYFDRECRPLLSNPLIEYLGELDMDAKIELLSHARCNLHPTGFREPFGLTVLEAAYCGTPTLAISRGALSELIEDGRTGILVEDYAEGCTQLDRCFTLNRAYIARRARQKFHYLTMASAYVQAYRTVVELHARTNSKSNVSQAGPAEGKLPCNLAGMLT